MNLKIILFESNSCYSVYRLRPDVSHRLDVVGNRFDVDNFAVDVNRERGLGVVLLVVVVGGGL